MKKAAKIALLILAGTSIGFAETPQQFGSWSVYRSSGDAASDQVVLVQAASQETAADAQGQPVQAKLDVICKKGHVSAVAVETNVAIQKSAMNFNGAIATTRIGFNDGGKSDTSENWAVLDGGHTLSPYSEIFQGKATRRWVERLASMQKLDLQFNPGADQTSMQPTFDTVDLSEALSSVGCTY